MLRRIASVASFALEQSSGSLAKASSATKRSFASVSTIALGPFSMKEAMLAKRKAKENERLGITEDEEGEEGMPWVDEELKRKMDEEEAQRKRDLEEATAAMLKEREARDKLKQEKFKQWRAAQIQGSKAMRSETAKSKAQRNQSGRMLASEVDASLEAKMEEVGDFKNVEVEFADIEEKRKAHRAHKQEARRMEREGE